jgi:hypothetical protein
LVARWSLGIDRQDFLKDLKGFFKFPLAARFPPLGHFFLNPLLLQVFLEKGAAGKK